MVIAYHNRWFIKLCISGEEPKAKLPNYIYYLSRFTQCRITVLYLSIRSYFTDTDQFRNLYKYQEIPSKNIDR